jgi:TolB protein
MRKLLFCLSLALAAGSSLSAAQPDTLAPIVRNISGDVIPIAVRSSDAAIQSLLTAAYTLHGAYVLTPAEKADYVFSVEGAGDNAVTLEILSGNPAQSLFKKVVQGKSRRAAVLAAADLAVAKTVKGLDGFFSGRIAFVGQKGGATELYTSDLFFEGMSQLTRDNAQCVRPSFSPDGRTILYTSYYRNGFPDIYRIDLASGKRDVFLSFNGVNTGAVFSPDGSRVAMILSGTGNAELYTITPDCRDMVRLTRNKTIESDPSFSPDGKSLVFASDAPGKPQLFTIATSGGSPRRLHTNISGYCAEPVWNPVDANLIAFTMMQGNSFAIALFNIATSECRVVSDGFADAIEPTWTSDGRHLIYTERTPNHRRLVVLDTKTGHKAYLGSAAWGEASQASFVNP